MQRHEFEWGGLFNSRAEAKTPNGRAYAMLNATVDQSVIQGRTGYTLIGERTGYSANDVCWGFGYGKYACNETQSLTVQTGIPTSGSIKLVFNSHTTATIAYNAQASDVHDALIALSDFRDGEIVCSGGPWPNEPIYVTFKGRYADAGQSLITSSNNTFNNSATLAIAHYVNGGSTEGYIVAVQPSGSGTANIYWVTSSDGFNTTTWTSLITGVTASDWKFIQLEDRIWASNATDGLLYYLLGGSWSGSPGIASVHDPVVAPGPISPTNDFGNPAGQAFPWNTGGGDATFGSYAGWGSNPTIAISSNKKYLTITLNAALAGDTVSFTATLNADQDFSRQDFWRVLCVTNPTKITFDSANTLFDEVNDDSSPLTLSPQFAGNDGQNDTAGTYTRYFHYGSVQRSSRDNVRKFDFTFTIPLGTSGQAFQLYLFPLDTWPMDMMSTLNIDAGPTQQSAEYAYTYLKASNLAESRMSPAALSPVVPPAKNIGCHVTIYAPGSADLTTSDYIKFYRKDRFGIWRFLGMVANVTSGQTSTVDKNMLDEIEGFPAFGTVQLPGGFSPTNIGLWKQCLVAAADRKVWIAKPGVPTVFAPDPEDFPAIQSFEVAFSNDPNAPRTAYMSSDRAQSCLAIIGQDSLYLAGQFDSYAMTDNDGTPNGLSPPRVLPGSRGCLGIRSYDTHSGGAVILSQSGAWYYSVSIGFQGTIGAGTIDEEELSKEVRGSYQTIFGSGPSGAVYFDFNEESYAVSGKDCIKWTRNHQIEQHHFADSFKDFVANQANGMIGATADGRLMKFGSSYTTDNGTEIDFLYATGLLEGPRTIIRSHESHYTGTPAIVIDAYDGLQKTASQRWDLTDALVTHFPMSHLALMQAWRYRVTVSGVGGRDTFESLVVMFDDLPGGKKS